MSLLTLPVSSSFATTTVEQGDEITLELISTTTKSDNSGAFVVKDLNSLLEIKGTGVSTVSTSGINSSAFEILNQGSLIFNNGTISTGNASKTIDIESGGMAEINTATIKNDRANSTAIYATGTGSSIKGDNLTIESSAVDSNGIGLYDRATASFNNLTINSDDFETAINVTNADLIAHGLTISQTSGQTGSRVLNVLGSDANNIATAKIYDANVEMNNTGNLFYMVSADSYSDVLLDGGKYTLNADNNTAFYVNDTAAKLTAENLTIQTNGTNNHAVDSRGEANFDNDTIITTGDKSYALYVDSNEAMAGTNPHEAVLTASNMIIKTSGANAHAVVAAREGVMNISDSTIDTTGLNSYLMTAMDDSTITAKTITGTTSGDKSHLMRSYASSNMTLTDSTLTATGDSFGIYATGFTTSDAAVVTLDNSSLTSKSDSIKASGANLEVNVINGSKLVSDNNVLLNTVSYIDATSSISTDSKVKLTADNVTLVGDVLAETNNQADIYLANATTWTGSATNAGMVDQDATSTWFVTGNSDVANHHSDGLTQFTHSGSDYSVLTVHGDTTGTGSFSINTWLGDDNSPTDKVAITGNLEGQHSLIVNNTGGSGALTTGDGINVVTVDGSSASDSLKLKGRVVQGAYEYMLYQGGTADANDWYLRSCYDCDVVPDPDPTPDPDPSSDPIPDPTPDPTPRVSDISWRSEIPGYIAAPALNMRYGFDTLGTYHQRTGGDVLHKDGAWGRTVGQHNEYDAGRFSYDTDTWYVQFGSDLYYNKDVNNNEHTAGVTFTMGTQSTDTSDSARQKSSTLSVNTGSVNSDIYSLGGYYTIKADDGGYIDTVGMASWYRNQYDSVSDAKQDGYGVALSVEVGKPFALSEHVKIEPQGQVKYQYLNLDSFHDDVSYVSGANSNNGEVRAGVRLFTDSNPDITPYLTLDALSSIGKQPDVQVSNQRLNVDIGDSWWQGGAGIAAKISDNTTIYTEMHYQKGFDSDSDGYSGGLGIKAKF